MQKRIVEPQADETRTESEVERPEPTSNEPLEIVIAGIKDKVHRLCMFCGEYRPEQQPTNYSSICTSPDNPFLPDTVGNKHHGYQRWLNKNSVSELRASDSWRMFGCDSLRARAEPSRGAPDAAHTPGPWTIDGWTTASVNVWAGEKHIVNVSTTKCGGHKSTVYAPEAEANARLIAQAPTLLAENEKLRSGHVVLLEALQPFADLLDEDGLGHMEESHFGSGDFVIQAADIRRARAAIQQAERGQ